MHSIPYLPSNGFDEVQGGAELDGIAIGDEDFFDCAFDFAFDFVHDFHCFDDADNGVGVDVIADFDEGFSVGARGGIETADHWRDDIDETGVFVGDRCWSRGGSGRWCGSMIVLRGG